MRLDKRNFGAYRRSSVPLICAGLSNISSQTPVGTKSQQRPNRMLVRRKQLPLLAQPLGQRHPVWELIEIPMLPQEQRDQPYPLSTSTGQLRKIKIKPPSFHSAASLASLKCLNR